MNGSDSVVIRAAEQGDIAPLSRLAMETYTDAFGHTMGADGLAYHLERYLSVQQFSRMLEVDVILVLEVEGRLVGFVQFGDLSPTVVGFSAGSQELRRLYVHRSYQHRGYGKLLMDFALGHPRLLTAERVVLDVWEHNHGAQRFYRRYGFEVVGSRPFEVGSGVGVDRDLVMVRQGSSRQGVSWSDPLSAETGEV